MYYGQTSSKHAHISIQAMSLITLRTFFSSRAYIMTSKSQIMNPYYHIYCHKIISTIKHHLENTKLMYTIYKLYQTRKLTGQETPYLDFDAKLIFTWLNLFGDWSSQLFPLFSVHATVGEKKPKYYVKHSMFLPTKHYIRVCIHCTWGCMASSNYNSF